MPSKLALDRAAYIIQMSDAYEAQRNMKPLPMSERELNAERIKEKNRVARSFEWRYEKLPRLQSLWNDYAIRNLTNPEEKILVAQALIRSRKAKLIFPEQKNRNGLCTIIMNLCRSIFERTVHIVNRTRSLSQTA